LRLLVFRVLRERAQLERSRCGGAVDPQPGRGGAHVALRVSRGLAAEEVAADVLNGKARFT